MRIDRFTALTAALLLLVLGAAACGGSDDGSPSADVPSEGCAEIEEPGVDNAGQHLSESFAASDYPTNPPSGGPHSDTLLVTGNFYSSPPPLGDAVHALEHGTVIGWTNGLSVKDQKAVEEEFNTIFGEGYYQLAVVENPELETQFALSAWGAVQRCGTVEVEAIRPFVVAHYGSDKSLEGRFACERKAAELPPCRAGD